MEQTMQYQKGIYTGQTENGLPHGVGRLEISDTQAFEGEWKDGKRHGVGHYSHISERDYDGIDSILIHHQRGVWTDDVLSGVVWEYRYEEDLDEKLSEECTFRDALGMELLGIDRDGNLIGALAPTLGALETRWDRSMFTRNGNRSWGKLEREGHTFIGQFSSLEERPYYAVDYLPHGFCVELQGGRPVYCGMFDMGQRKGPGVVPADDADSRFAMDFRIF